MDFYSTISNIRSLRVACRDLSLQELEAFANKLNEIVEYYDLISPVSENIWRNTDPDNLTSFFDKDMEQLYEYFTPPMLLPAGNNRLCSCCAESISRSISV